MSESNNNSSLISMQLLKLCIQYKSIIIRNVIITVLIVSVISIIMPKTFKSSTVLMLPASNSDDTILPNLGQITIGNIISPNNNESKSIFAILKSRTMAESVINKMNLLELYNSLNMEEGIKSFKNNLIISESEEGTISVGFFAHTQWFPNKEASDNARQMSVDIVNYIVKELDRLNKFHQTDEAHYQRKFLEKRHNETILNLYKAEEQLRQFQLKNNTMDLIEQTKAAISIGADIKSQILVEEVKLGVLSKTYKSNHPEIQKLKLQIKELSLQLAELDSNNEIDSNNNILPQYSQVPNISTELIRLQREVEIQSNLYLFLSEKYEASKIQEARDTPTIHILDEANYPFKRFAPKRKLLVIGYSLIILIGTIFYIILFSYYKKNIEN